MMYCDRIKENTTYRGRCCLKQSERISGIEQSNYARVVFTKSRKSLRIDRFGGCEELSLADAKAAGMLCDWTRPIVMQDGNAQSSNWGLKSEIN